MRVPHRYTRILLILLLCFLSFFQSEAQVRRALLVGINSYRNTNIQSDYSFLLNHRLIKNLNGPVNDVNALREILIARYGFNPQNILVLIDSQATRQGILAAIQSQLIELSEKGDMVLFYYSGHGSQVKNSKSNKQSPYDQTIVPSDILTGGKDIRDKELARLYNQILDKGAVLTVIMDCCHSGSNARGLPSERVNRNLSPDEKDIADPTVVSPTPEERGALVLAASQEFESAAEWKFNDGYYGVLTHTLIRVLRESPVTQSADRLFLSLRAFMKSDEFIQEPVLSGTAERRGETIFGRKATDLSGKSTIAVLKVSDDGSLELQGGIAVGIRENCELKKIGAQACAQIRIKITETLGITRCKGKVIEGELRNISPGDLFEMDRYAFSNDALLRIWMPPPLNFRKVVEIAKAMSTLKNSNEIEWIDDPTEETPTHIMYFDGSKWQLSFPGNKVVSLGKNPSAKKVLKQLVGENTKPKLFIQLPPPELVSNFKLHFSEADNVICMATKREECGYILTGRFLRDTVRYAWIIPNATIADTTPLPIRTDWIPMSGAEDQAAYDRLDEYAARLAKLKGWLDLTSNSSENDFPYHLGLKNLLTGAVKTEGTLIQNERYRLILNADSNQSYYGCRFVYIFIMEQDGTCKLLYPKLQYGNVENCFPNLDAGDQYIPPEIVLNLPPLHIVPPFGTDTYVMLSTTEALPDIAALAFEGVVSRGEATKGTFNPLTRLLIDVGSATRGRDPNVVPTIFSVERSTFKSVRESH